MQYKITTTPTPDGWVYIIMFGQSPDMFADASNYSDEESSAEDPRGVRHYVLSRAGKIVQIQLHAAEGIVPNFDTDPTDTTPMPEFFGVMHGNPPVPTVLISFAPVDEGNKTAFGLSPNVYMVFDADRLAQIYITDATNVLEGVTG